MDLAGAVLTLYFDAAQRFGMGQVAKAHEAVAAAVEEVTGRTVHVRCSVDEDDGGQAALPASPPPSPGGAEPPPPAGPASTEGGGEGESVDPTVRSVLDALDGEFV